jgi:hypothetical protein
MNTHKNQGRIWISGGIAVLAGLLAAASAMSHPAKAPTAVTISLAPGGATCTYNERATPKTSCAKLKNQRIKSGTRVTVTGKANAALPAGWKLFIYHQYVGQNRNDFIRAGGAAHRASFRPPYLCSTSSGTTCSKVVTHIVKVTAFDLYRAIVQKDDGTNFEAQMYVRWCDTSTVGCI